MLIISAYDVYRETCVYLKKVTDIIQKFAESKDVELSFLESQKGSVFYWNLFQLIEKTFY